VLVQVAMLHNHMRLFAWLAATADWATPLHIYFLSTLQWGNVGGGI